MMRNAKSGLSRNIANSYKVMKNYAQDAVN